MRIKNVMNVVTRGFGRQVLKGQKHSPTILFAAGIVGVVATAVLASRATLKLHEVLDDVQADLASIEEVEQSPHNQGKYTAEDAKKDRILVHMKAGVAIAKIYAPAVIVGVASIAALSGSHVIMSRRNVALTAAYAALDKGFRQYRARVQAELGEDKEREFRYGLTEREIVEETKNGPVTKRVKDVMGGASIYARCFEKGMTDKWDPRPHQNQMLIGAQQNWANNMLQTRGHVFLNEVYDMLGLSRTKAGACVGWVKGDSDGDDYIDFGVLKGNIDNATRFLCGDEQSVWLDFNVDGVILDKI